MSSAERTPCGERWSERWFVELAWWMSRSSILTTTQLDLSLFRGATGGADAELLLDGCSFSRGTDLGLDWPLSNNIDVYTPWNIIMDDVSCIQLVFDTLTWFERIKSDSNIFIEIFMFWASFFITDALLMIKAYWSFSMGHWIWFVYIIVIFGQSHFPPGWKCLLFLQLS